MTVRELIVKLLEMNMDSDMRMFSALHDADIDVYFSDISIPRVYPNSVWLEVEFSKDALKTLQEETDSSHKQLESPD